MAIYCVLCNHSIHVNHRLHIASQCTVGQKNCKCYDPKKCVSCKRVRAMRAKQFQRSEMIHKIQNTQRAAKAAAFVALKQYTQKKREQKKSCVGGLVSLMKKVAIATSAAEKSMLKDIKHVTKSTARIVL